MFTCSAELMSIVMTLTAAGDRLANFLVKVHTLTNKPVLQLGVKVLLWSKTSVMVEW